MNTPSTQEIDRHYFTYESPSRDPKDATIASLTEQRDALKGEVERLAGDLKASGIALQLADAPQAAAEAKESSVDAGNLLRRLGLALAGLLLGSSLYAKAIQPVGPKMPTPRHVTKPISTITVKVVQHADYLRVAKPSEPWHITTADEDSCTAWIDTRGDVDKNEPAALKACRAAIDKEVDAAHAKAGG